MSEFEPNAAFDFAAARPMTPASARTNHSSAPHRLRNASVCNIREHTGCKLQRHDTRKAKRAQLNRASDEQQSATTKRSSSNIRVDASAPALLVGSHSHAAGRTLLGCYRAYQYRKGECSGLVRYS